MDTKVLISTKSLVIAALFIALSFVGSYLKIFGTIAFDSLPAFLAALLLGPIYGAAIGFLGHLFTALTSGFPLSVPMHFVIAASMAITMYGFGFTYRALAEKFSQATVLTVTGIVGILLNAPVSLFFSMAMMSIMVGREVALGLLALLPALLSAAIANVAISIIVFKAMRKVWDRIM